jgi:S-(hydroxymethyl)glutathione dehydrogenase/alcohol dehydrogenase
MRTSAAVLNEINTPLAIEELVVPKLREGQVLVDVAYSGLCRTQLNEIHGSKGRDKYVPHTLGHEGAGVVREIGPGVKKVDVGDHVVLTWIKGGGADVPSASYERPDGTKVNSGAISTLITLTVVSENRLVKIPEAMPLREASLLGCAIPTGAGIVRNTVKVVAGSSIAVFGVGGIGLSALLMAKAARAGTIVAVDIYSGKLEQARALGATHTIQIGQQDALSVVRSLTNQRGVDYAIESAGTRQSMETAFQCVRDQGGLCVLAGNLPAGQHISIDPFDLIKGKRIVGSWGGETKPDTDIPDYVDAYLSSNFEIGSLITHEYRLPEVNQAFEALEQGKAGRILVNMTNDCNESE